jgi:hypothetical protein
MPHSDKKKSGNIPDDLLKQAKTAQGKRSDRKSRRSKTARQTEKPPPAARPPKRLNTQDLDQIARQYEQSTGVSPWVGYGFTSSGGANPETIYLFTMNKEHSCLELSLDDSGIYSLKNETWDLVWSGFSIDEMAKTIF